MEAICPKCGALYYGWSLDNPRKHRCDICHTDLKILDEREHIEENQSPNEHPKDKISPDKKKEENTEK